LLQRRGAPRGVWRVPDRESDGDGLFRRHPSRVECGFIVIPAGRAAIDAKRAEATSQLP
jgi:hypothetical protein